MRKIISLTTVAAVAAAFAFTPAKVEAKGYGMAGCGLGAIVFGSDPGMIQVLAATTNATFYSQTFGITTGTSECTDGGALKAEVEQKVYAHNNFESLQSEMAKGEGEKLTSFAHLMGCSADSVSTFSSVTQQNYNTIFNETTTPEDMLKRVKEVASKDATLTQSCTRL